MTNRLRRRTDSQSRRVRREPGQNAPRSLSLVGLGAIIAVSAVFVICGSWLLSVQFEARDYEMETRTRQEQLLAARDQLKEREAEAGRLYRDEFLREAALGPLGMVDPLPVSVAEMNLDDARRRELATAASQVRRALIAERLELDHFPKEAQ